MRLPLLVAALLALLPASASAEELIVSVAISMKEATEELGRVFVRSRPGVRLRYNFGSSGELQKQIEAGGPGGGVLSPAPRPMAEAERHGAVPPAPPPGGPR